MQENLKQIHTPDSVIPYPNSYLRTCGLRTHRLHRPGKPQGPRPRRLGKAGALRHSQGGGLLLPAVGQHLPCALQPSGGKTESPQEQRAPESPGNADEASGLRLQGKERGSALPPSLPPLLPLALSFLLSVSLPSPLSLPIPPLFPPLLPPSLLPFLPLSSPLLPLSFSPSSFPPPLFLSIIASLQPSFPFASSVYHPNLA